MYCNSHTLFDSTLLLMQGHCSVTIDEAIYIQGRYMKEMKFIGFSVSFVMIHGKELLLGDKGMLFKHEFHFDLQQIHRKQFKTVSSCSAFVSYS